MNSIDQKGKDESMIEAFVKQMISQVQNENTKEYINNRILPQIRWYSLRSEEKKHKYYFWMTVSIVLGSAISSISVLANGSTWMKLIIAILGAAVTASNAYISLHSFKDLWVVYRKTHETLTQALYYYFTNAGVYSKCSAQNEKDEMLVIICEEEISKENGDWSIILKK
ncbi:MAG: DUF4231 domain-containing protein [Eubacterium sp.]|nr:DUF4231 domain-containing protein [Eubacterium sp.]